MEWSATVTVERREQGRDAHGAVTDGALAEVFVDVPAVVYRPSAGNLYRIILAGDWTDATLRPKAYRAVDQAGRVFTVFKATFRAPVPSVSGSAHSVLFCEHDGEVNKEAVV